MKLDKPGGNSGFTHTADISRYSDFSLTNEDNHLVSSAKSILGDFGDCTSSNQCGEDEGDCDNDDQCEGNLKCGTNNCRSSLGFPRLFDCCYNEEEDFCTIDSPCGINEGDCDYTKSNYKPTHEDKHNTCQDGLLCGFNNCPHNSSVDCCYAPVAGEEDFCLSGIPCGVDDGDCDSDEECGDNLYCGSNNCPDTLGFQNGADCCFNKTSHTIFSLDYPKPGKYTDETWPLSTNAGWIINLQFHSFLVCTM